MLVWVDGAVRGKVALLRNIKKLDSRCVIRGRCELRELSFAKGRIEIRGTLKPMGADRVTRKGVACPEKIEKLAENLQIRLSRVDGGEAFVRSLYRARWKER